MSNYFPSNPTQYPEDNEQTTPLIGGYLDTFAFTGHDQWYSTEQPSTAPPLSSASAKSRSRNPLGQDHVKHRRTRSGCYTCRERRVKCDEARPTCERCKKGSRKCVYPEPRPNTKPSSNSNSKLGQARASVPDSGSSSGDYDEEEKDADAEPLKKPPAIDRNAKAASKMQRRSRAASSKTSRRPSSPSHDHTWPAVEQAVELKEKSLSPSTDDSSVFSATQSISAGFKQTEKLSSVSTVTSQEASPWSHLASNLQYHLEYHQQLSYHHYFFRHDSSNFIHNILVEHAISYEPLLYAIVGFAAFQETLQNRKGKIQDFLGYYNISVTLLRKSLSKGQEHTHATLLTILQLATFEEYLGDWVNLLGHQKAAYGILTELYTPETIMETETRRRTLEWYSRFDLFAGLMAGHELVLGRNWFHVNDEYYRQQLSQDRQNINLQIESAIARHRLTAVDMAMLFAKMSRGEITVEDFTRENALITQRIGSWMNDLKPLLNDPRYLVTSFEGARQQDPEGIVNPYMPGGLYQRDLWSVNFLLLDWTAMEMMHKGQTALILRQQPAFELQQVALEICRLFEAIEHWPHSPPGAVVAAQAVIGLAAPYLPKDEKHTMWCRRKLAKVEGLGYIYPPTFRSRMAELWGVPEIRHWWLPHDEGYPAIVRDIRSFIEDRIRHFHKQPKSEDVRTMKAVFSKLSVQNSEQGIQGPEGGFDSHPQSPILEESSYFGGMRPKDSDLQPNETARYW